MLRYISDLQKKYVEDGSETIENSQKLNKGCHVQKHSDNQNLRHIWNDGLKYHAEIESEHGTKSACKTRSA